MKPEKRKWVTHLRRTVLILFILLAITLFAFYKLHTSVTKNLDNFVYDLPFDNGKSYKVVQGYGGLFSHQKIAALDFEMPAGTGVYAARGGVIYSFRD